MSDAPEILESPEEVLSTLRSDGKRRWIYPVTSRGDHWKRRRVVGWGLIALFVALPLVKIDGKPAILLDIMTREFTFFGLTLYPTDTLLLMIFLLIVMLAVFLFTALLGRVWCGWACPQTVYLEFVYRPIEELIEGKASTRKRRDEGPATFDRLWRKVLKWTVFGVIAVALAHVFVAYFVGWDRLVVWMTGSPNEHWGFFVVMAATSALILFDFGFFREQMCTITCPYARFQSVLQDRDSLIVSYDPVRGEPRGRRSRAQREAEKKGESIALGDCIDCGACVRTCPTGIDIREGLQMECVACTQCIDACNDIMNSISKPEGLIRYTSENQVEGKPGRVLRPRVVGYSLLLVALVAAFVTVLSVRGGVEVNIGRAVGAPFLQMPDGDISNRLRFRVQNRTSTDATFTVRATDPADLEVKLVGPQKMTVPAGETKRVQAFVIAPAHVFDSQARREATFVVEGDDGTQEEAKFMLLGPNE